jgi:hypothetical protein
MYRDTQNGEPAENGPDLGQNHGWSRQLHSLGILQLRPRVPSMDIIEYLGDSLYTHGVVFPQLHHTTYSYRLPLQPSSYNAASRIRADRIFDVAPMMISPQSGIGRALPWAL